MKAIYTVGYEGCDIEQIVAALKLVGTSVLVDVRERAQSRKKGFSKSALRDYLADNGIDYRHLQELGDPKPGREAARLGNYEDFQRIYRHHFSGSAAQGAFETLRLMAADKSCCLLCFERDPKVCHRSIVAEKLEIFGFRTIDLYGFTPTRHVDNTVAFPSRNSCKGTAAA